MVDFPPSPPSPTNVRERVKIIAQNVDKASVAYARRHAPIAAAKGPRRKS
jgi:hypothetical protein